jgi:hypothetical protein
MGRVRYNTSVLGTGTLLASGTIRGARRAANRVPRAASPAAVPNQPRTSVGRWKWRSRRRIVMASYKLTMGSAFLLRVICLVAAYLAVCCLTYGQTSSPDQEVRVPHLPSLTARSTHASDVRYFHCFTPSMAAEARSGSPLTTCRFSTSPSLLTIAPKITWPWIRAFFAASGYCGAHRPLSSLTSTSLDS